MLPLSPGLFRDLADFAPEALILVGTDGVIAYANHYAHTVFAYEPGALEGMSVELLMPEEFRAPHAAHRHAFGEKPRLREMGQRNVPLFGMRRDGTRFPVEIRLAPVQTVQGLIVAAAVRDTTQAEQCMSRLAAARKAAEEANEAKGRLLAAASHDLRQPLQTLSLLNGAMKRLARDPPMKEVLGQAERALNVMSELLHALLNIARVESGTLQTNFAAVSLPVVFEDLRQQFAALANLKKLELRVVTPALLVRTDQVLLREILQNLLANAVRYTDRGTVTLSCVLNAAGRATIEVADTGIGIDQAAQSRIFDDFFQVAASGNGHRGGTGLGLGIVRRLCRLLDIPIRVESRVDAGTCFTLEVAVVDQPARDVVEPGSTGARPTGQVVLLIEDNCSMRDALRTYLQLDDHTVHTAGSLGELADVLAALPQPPAIVISDFHLGATERGSDAIERVRHHFGCFIPAILLTGDTSAIPARFSNEAGVRILCKPVDAQRLVVLIDELVHAENLRVSGLA